MNLPLDIFARISTKRNVRFPNLGNKLCPSVNFFYSFFFQDCSFCAKSNFRNFDSDSIRSPFAGGGGGYV